MKCLKESCRAGAIKEDEYCYFHSQKPEVVEKRKRARIKGGSRGKLKRTDDHIETVEDIKIVLVETINELRSSGTGDSVGKSRAVGYLCSIMLTALEKGDLEERLANLEEMLTTSATKNYV